MRFSNGSAFRRALEDRLRASSISSGTPLVRLRKMVAFDRFLAHLLADQPKDWILKGGFALELRLGNRARTTKDIDLLLTSVRDPSQVHQALVRAESLDLGDWFQFQVARPRADVGLRFNVQGLLDARPFESFHVDVGMDDPVVEPPEMLTTFALLEFAGVQPTEFPCYPLSQQIAEKVHACTRSYATAESTRVKDWVDILLMAEMRQMEGRTLRRAIKATFDARGTHSLPVRMPEPSTGWTSTFYRLVREVGLGYRTLAEAHNAMSRFLDPVLSGQPAGIWDPAVWMWK